MSAVFAVILLTACGSGSSGDGTTNPMVPEEEVVQHYDIDVANEFITPEVNRNIADELAAGSFIGLGLNAPDDYNALVAFMKTLTDGSGVGICF